MLLKWGWGGVSVIVQWTRFMYITPSYRTDAVAIIVSEVLQMKFNWMLK